MEIELAGAYVFPEGLFPPVRGPRNSVSPVAWATEHRTEIRRLADSHGAVLLRGLPVRSAEDFHALVVAIGLPPFAYADSLSNAHRISFTDRVFSANEAPAHLPIYLHHEMAQTPLPPSALFFFCEVAADQGGATPLCRSDILWERISQQIPEFSALCEEKGLRYTNVMAGCADLDSSMGRSWRSTFRADSPEAAEERMHRLGYTWEWLPEDALRATSPVLPAVRRLADGRKSFFNQFIAATQGWNDTRNESSRAITYGDGSPIDAQHIRRVNTLADELVYDLCWEPGDICLVNNYLVMHGRRPFTGQRRVLASLTIA